MAGFLGAAPISRLYLGTTAVSRLYLGASLIWQVPAVEPTTVNVPGTAFREGIAGPKNTGATQTQWSAEPTVWVGKVKGASATLTNIWTYPTSAAVGPRVSIDGGPFVVIDVRTLPAVLFSGLADVEHDVVIRAPTAAGNAFWTASDARPVLNVTGVEPYMRVMPPRAQTFDGVFKTASFALAGPASRTPAQVSPVRDPNRGPSLASLAFRGSFARLGFVALLNGGAKHAVFVSVDGGAPIKLTSLSQSVAYWTPPAGVHDFIVWAGNLSTSSSLAVLADEVATPLDLPRLHHFGHSLVEGNSAESGSGVTDLMATAARNGLIPGNLGVAGNTTPQLLSRLPTLLTGLTVTGADVAILDIGRNDATAGSDTLDGQYGELIDLLVAKGYGKVVCLSQINYGPGINTRFAAVAAAKGVTWIDRDSYWPIATVDGLHPSDAGYVQMDAKNVATIDRVIP